MKYTKEIEGPAKIAVEKLREHLQRIEVAKPARDDEFLSAEIRATRAGAAVPTEWRARKALPITSGVLDYFPDALLAVAEVSRIGNEQHNPGQPIHWNKEKSTDEADALLRHLIDRGKLDTDGLRHSAKVAWRALALLQREIEAERHPTEKNSSAYFADRA